MTTTPNPRSIASASLACGLAAGMLLAACSSGSSSTHATTSAAHPTSASSVPSTAVVTTAPAVADTSIAGTSSAGTSSAGTSPATAPSAGGSACALITESDATAVLGKDPGHGRAFSSHGSSQCQYGTYQTQFLLVNLTPSQGRASYEMVHSHQKPGQNVSIVDIAGVGDRAFEVSGPHTAGIYANKNDALVVVTVSILAVASPPKAAVLALAKLAASRL